MSERFQKRVTVATGGLRDLEEPLATLRDRIDGWLAQVPSQYRDAVELDMNIDPDFGSEYEIGYWRLETDDEMAARLVEEQRSAQRQAAAERRQYEQLKAKYERP